jgi:hypothetical protein
MTEHPEQAHEDRRQRLREIAGRLATLLADTQEYGDPRLTPIYRMPPGWSPSDPSPYWPYTGKFPERCFPPGSPALQRQRMTWRHWLLIGLGIVWLAGGNYLSTFVRGSCIHGNCRHGWYSKYNAAKRSIATAWIVGFPMACGLTWLILSSRKDRLESKRTAAAMVARIQQEKASHHKEA